MGYSNDKRPVGFSGGIAVPVETVTLSSAVQTLTNEGISFVTYGTSGKPSDAIIPDPSIKGLVKTVVLDNNTTSLEANFNLGSTGSVLWGTTFNTITADSTVSISPHFTLTAVTTDQWALTGLSSTVDWAFAATTGSTGQT